MRRAFFFLTMLLPCACSLVLDWDDRSFGAESDAATDDSGALPIDAPTTFDGPTLEEGGACPSGMINVGSYCIDATEVTNSAYAPFLAAAIDAGTQVPHCTWNKSFVPNGFSSALPDYPVVNVDWCDAFTFCAWAGKRLCGRIGGGGATSTPREGSQWFEACSKSGGQKYPYGDDYQRDACRTEAESPAAVGSRPSCVGAFDGLFDMSGNVAEWEDSCADNGVGADCSIRGGSYEAEEASEATCAVGETSARTRPSNYVGFRCCFP